MSKLITYLVVALGIVLASPAMAQLSDAETENVGPADKTAEQQRETETLEPGVDSSDPDSGIRRRQQGNRVIDELDLSTTTITGNQELPKVLYIVPWKQSSLGDLVGRPVNSLLDEVLEPIDRDVFRREIGYYQNLHQGDTAPE